MELIEQIGLIFDNYGIETQILAASVRHQQHLLSCMLVGADVATMPFNVINSMIKHPLTDSGLEKFLADHAKMVNR
jgi:transaldolase